MIFINLWIRGWVGMNADVLGEQRVDMNYVVIMIEMVFVCPVGN
jgi:hypothetical protein